MADNFEDNPFSVTFSHGCWLVAYPGVEIRLLEVKAPNVNAAVALFTDEDLAQTALESSPYPEKFILRQLTDPRALYDFLVVLKEKGIITHVCIDPDPSGKRRCSFYPIDDAIALTARWLA